MKILSDLIINNNEDSLKYSGVTEVSGNLSIYSDSKLDSLTSVGGDLYIYSEAKLDAPDLTSVGRNLYINSEAKLDAPALISVGGNLYIYSEDKLDAPDLTSVGGYLYIYSEAKLYAPDLTSVGGNLIIHSYAKLDAPALTSVGGDLYIYSEAKLDAPALTSVGGDLYIYSEDKLDAPNLYPQGFNNFKVIDSIACVYVSIKTKGEFKILSCREAKIKNKKLVGKKFYVASKGEINAHGKTIAEAMSELAFKTKSRDISQYKNMPMETTKSPVEWAIIYRTITGACKFGVENFMSTRKLKKKYTLKEIINETKGQYGHDNFLKCVV